MIDLVECGRLIAWLRRLDMPLDLIRTGCGPPPEAAAREIERYRARIAAARDRLAAFLVDRFARRADTMATPLAIQYAARSGAGHRYTNEDAAYAGARLLDVADGEIVNAPVHTAYAAGAPDGIAVVDLVLA